MDKRNKMIDKENYVWECLSCNRKKISNMKPETCVCGQPQFVINEHLIVTK